MDPTPTPDRPRLARSLAGLLAFSAIAYFGYALGLGLAPADAGPFETVLARAVAGHFDPAIGPGRFYGPFSGANPSVLMHAPLYYRAVALASWPFVAIGADPLSTVLYVGRVLALLGALLTFSAVAGLARVDDAPARSAWLAVGLLAASPILGNLATMVRPDVPGVGLQSAGALLVMRALRDQTGRARRLAIAYTCFVLAFFAKQQDVTVPAVCCLLLGFTWLRGRIGWRPLASGILAGLLTGLAILGVEAWLTGGQMIRAVFVLPGGPFRAINYAGWEHVRSIFDITARRSVGLIALAVACVAGLGRNAWRGRLDATIGLFLAVELVALVPLCLFNAGAAYNYALQAIVFACVLVGRSLDRLFIEAEGHSSRFAGRIANPRAVGLAAAAVGMIGLALNDVRLMAQDADIRNREGEAVAALLSDSQSAGCPSDARYFVGRHHLNRLVGSRALIHDDWLYGAFEQVEVAEPRESWLRSAIADGPIRQVIVPDDGATVPGIAEPLPDLGYHREARYGEFRLWVRRENLTRR